MKKLIYVALAVLFSLSSFGQQIIKGKIIDKETQEPLAFANVILSKTTGTVTDAKGNFYLEIGTDVKQLEIRYIGYEHKILPLSPQVSYYDVQLNPTAESLETVVISGKYVNPAIVLMKKILKKKSGNDYRNKLKKYSFVKYYKFLVTANPDSINGNLDTIYHNGKFAKIDSTLYEFKKELTDKDLFIMESVMKVNAKSGIEKHKVIATRTAGFKNPMYEILALQVSNQNVYDDNYKFLIKEYLGPLTKLSLKQYKYELNDSVTIQNRKVYVLDYKNTQKPLISGKLYIDANSLAIAKMTLNTFEQFELQTTHNFTYYPKYDAWFPLHAKMTIKKATKKEGVTLDGMFTVGSKKRHDSIKHSNKDRIMDYMYATSKTLFSEVNIGNLHRDKIIYNLQVSPDAHTKPTDFWNNYRDLSRVKRELNTYTYIDSIVEKEGIEGKLDKFRKLAKGYYPLGYFDFNFTDLLDKNEYEGFRVALGGKTNEKVSDNFFIDAYIAYGFKDKALKYHGQFNYKLSHLSQTYLHAAYTKDLQKSAAFTSRNNSILNGNMTQLSDDKFFMNTAYEFGVSHLFSKALKTDLILKKQAVSIKHERPHIGRIEFKDTDITSLSLDLEFQPFSTFFLSPTGRKNLKQGYPKFYLNIEKSLPSWQVSSQDFYRIDFQTKYKKTYLNKQYTQMFFKAGYASKGANLTHLFSPKTNGYNYDANQEWYQKIHLKTAFSFETMHDLEFTDNFVSTLHLKHTFSKLKITNKYNFDISLISRAAWGTSFLSSRYAGIKTLEKGYFESGVEFNRLLKLFGQGFGVGFYYKMGAYASTKPLDNLAVKLTFTPFKFFK